MGLGVLCPQDRNRSIYPLAPSLLGQGLLYGVLAPFFCKCEHVSDALNRLLQPLVRKRETLLAAQAGGCPVRPEHQQGWLLQQRLEIKRGN